MTMECENVSFVRWLGALSLGFLLGAVLVTVTAAVIGVTVSIWPAIVARDKGYFEEEGIRVDFVTAGASARTLQQVAAGVAHVGSSSMVDTVRAIEAGA